MGRPGSEALDELYWRAEILQALYWMRGEGLGTEIAPARLADFLGAAPGEIDQLLARLATDGYLEAARGDSGVSGSSAHAHGPPAAYRLTPLGVQEGGRSFHDEFADYLRQPHGECGANCWCKDPKHAGEPCPNREGEHVHP
jgi:hypothetical protein